MLLFRDFFKDLLPKKINIYEHNFKYFNEREFEEELNKMNWDSILHLDISDPNTSMDNLYNNLVYMLDEYAPYKKISKKEFKLKSEPWIDSEIRNKIYERDKLIKKYRKSKDENRKLTIYEDYKRTRNFVTNMKRDAKTKYYQQYFETYKWKSSKVWKGIKSIVKLNTTSKKDISLIDNKGFNVTDPSKIANLFNNYFVNIGPSIDKAILNSETDFRDILKNIKVNNTFFLSPTIPEEIFKIIASLDKSKSLGPNSLPIYILKLYNNFFSEKLAKIINVAFATSIFPELLKLAKVIPTFKKGNELLCENYRPISLLSVFSKIFEKVIYTRMYDYLMKNNLIYKRLFGFRNNHSTNHALISLSENIKSNLDSGQFSAGIFIDLQKAFDTVNHEILCEKLLHYGFRGIPQKCFYERL